MPQVQAPLGFQAHAHNKLQQPIEEKIILMQFMLSQQQHMQTQHQFLLTQQQ